MTDIDTITDAADYRTACVQQVIGGLMASVVMLSEADDELRGEVAELAAQDPGTTTSMVADYVRAHPPEEFYAHEQRQVPLTRAGNAEMPAEHRSGLYDGSGQVTLHGTHYRDRAAEDAAEQDAAPVIQDIVVSHAGMLDTRKLGRPAAQPHQPSAQLSERLYDEPAALQLSADQAESEILRLAATRDKQQSKHYHEHDCSGCSDPDCDGDPSDTDQDPSGGHDEVQRLIKENPDLLSDSHGRVPLLSSLGSPGNRSGTTRDVGPEEWGQRNRTLAKGKRTGPRSTVPPGAGAKAQRYPYE